jgi:hypothetical protein
MAATSNTKTSIPLLLRMFNCDGATCFRWRAKDCRAKDEGENWMVDGARADDGVTGTIAQFVDSGEWEGVHGAMAMCKGLGRSETRSPSW